MVLHHVDADCPLGQFQVTLTCAPLFLQCTSNTRLTRGKLRRLSKTSNNVERQLAGAYLRCVSDLFSDKLLNLAEGHTRANTPTSCSSGPLNRHILSLPVTLIAATTMGAALDLRLRSASLRRHYLLHFSVPYQASRTIFLSTFAHFKSSLPHT